MEQYIFNKLREKAKENNIDIFKVDDYYGKKFTIHYFIDRALKENEPIEGSNDKMSYQLREKTIEVDAITSLSDVITQIKLQNTKKPPFGLIPHYIWIEQRIEDIIKAIDRYREVNKEIPKEWYFELTQLETEKSSKEKLSLKDIHPKTINVYN